MIEFRASSIGRLMTNPRSKSSGPLSEGAKTYISEIASARIFGISKEISTRQMEKGLLVEQDSIDLLNKTRGLDLVKNKERRNRDGLTGLCDLVGDDRGHDIKSSWSVFTFPLFPEQGQDKIYEWQCRAYMALWNLDIWEVNYCLVDTPEHLIGYEDEFQHIVSHIPEHYRVTTVVYQRDKSLELGMFERIKQAKDFYDVLMERFLDTHVLKDGGEKTK